MRGALVTNHYVRSEPFLQLFAMLMQAAEDQGVSLTRVSNFEVLLHGFAQKPDFVLFWDKDVRLARELERQGFRLFNRAGAIESCDDKSRSYTIAQVAGIPCPDTLIAPMLHHPINWDREPLLADVEQRFGYPVVVKECYGSFGQRVYLAKNRAELEQLCDSIGTRPFLFQRFVETSAGRDLRINLVGGRIVAAMQRQSTGGDFRANVARGARCIPHTPTERESEMALSAAAALGLDFGGLDLLFGEEGPLFCEANSNLHFQGIYACTGVNTAEHILAHIKREMG